MSSYFSFLLSFSKSSYIIAYIAVIVHFIVKWRLMIASAMEDTSTASYHCGVGRGLLGFVFHAYVYKRAYAAGIKKRCRLFDIFLLRCDLAEREGNCLDNAVMENFFWYYEI